MVLYSLCLTLHIHRDKSRWLVNAMQLQGLVNQAILAIFLWECSSWPGRLISSSQGVLMTAPRLFPLLITSSSTCHHIKACSAIDLIHFLTLQHGTCFANITFVVFGWSSWPLWSLSLNVSWICFRYTHNHAGWFTTLCPRLVVPDATKNPGIKETNGSSV